MLGNNHVVPHVITQVDFRFRQSKRKYWKNKSMFFFKVLVLVNIYICNKHYVEQITFNI